MVILKNFFYNSASACNQRIGYRKGAMKLLKKQSLEESLVLSNLHSRPNVATNSSENENTFPMNNFAPGDVTYADTYDVTYDRHRQNYLVIFGELLLAEYG